MKTLIAVPCMSMVHMEFSTALMNMRKLPGTTWAPKIGSLVYDSRNAFAATAINAENNYDRVLWLDSDMVFMPDLMERLSADMDEGRDLVCGLYFKRELPTCPVIYESLTYDRTDNIIKASAVPMRDYPKDRVFEVAGCGFGAVMTSVPLLKRVWEKYGPPFDPMSQMGEDLSFCWRMGQMGEKIYCDSRVKLGHVGTMIYDEAVYLSQNVGGQKGW